MEITVLESVKGKWGPQIKDEKGYLSFGKFFKGDTEFDPGTVLDVDLYTSPKGGRYINSLKLIGGKSEPKATASVASIPKTEVEKTVKKSSKAVAFGRELSAYELEKDRRIGVAGVVQAVEVSEAYGHHVALTDIGSEESMKALRKWFREEAEFMLALIKEKSE